MFDKTDWGARQFGRLSGQAQREVAAIAWQDAADMEFQEAWSRSNMEDAQIRAATRMGAVEHAIKHSHRIMQRWPDEKRWKTWLSRDSATNWRIGGLQGLLRWAREQNCDIFMNKEQVIAELRKALRDTQEE